MKAATLIGRIGEFTGGDGVVYQCLVTGTDEPPWDDLSLVIDYCRDGRKITGAMIPVHAFRPDTGGGGGFVDLPPAEEKYNEKSSGAAGQKAPTSTLTSNPPSPAAHG